MNPQTLAQAKIWWQQSTSETDYIQRVLAFYRNNFTYTLSPPKLGEHTVDEFLFASQQGFCEHFSSSFVVLMRSVGIPARIVAGYQGGTWSDDKQYLSVYQRDAHAWAEVWLNGQGWTRVDPTAAVAAMRIEQGVEAALPAADRQQLNIPKRSYAWVNRLYSQWQQLDYRWQSWVLSYDAEQQQSLLSRYLGDITPVKMMLVILLPLLAIALLLWLATFRHTLVPQSTEIRLYRQLTKKLQRLGVDQQTGESITDHCRRAATTHPHLQQPLEAIQIAFEQALYAGNGDWQRVKQALKQLKL